MLLLHMSTYMCGETKGLQCYTFLCKCHGNYFEPADAELMEMVPERFKNSHTSPPVTMMSCCSSFLDS